MIETKHWLDVYEELTALANNESIRGSNSNILIRKKNNSGLILDPTIRFENCELQLKLINEEKLNICLMK